jgi:rhamnulokinase
VRAFFAAIDLGAGSGRVFVGHVGPAHLEVREVHRFHYAPRVADGHLRWDMPQLAGGMRAGLCRARDAARSSGGELISAGVDAWGVDYGLVDREGNLLEDPICYRDGRTIGAIDRVCARVTRETIFEATGIQFLPFNTLFQLAAHVRAGLPARAARLLLIPDLCHHVLCGSTVGELTNASTTQLLNLGSGDWDDELMQRVGLPRAIMPELVPPGTALGRLRADLAVALDLPALRVVAPATHDTASAVLGTPLERGWAYISSGTWSLVGVERAAPLTGAAVLQANFTNERGVGGTIRFLKNVMGLWILESCRREITVPGAMLPAIQPDDPGGAGLIFPDAPRFFHPRSMVHEVRAALEETGQPSTGDLARLTKVILDSLALRYASVIDTIEALTSSSIEGIHIIGGGSLNDYLNQATANATGRLVLAGPVEATSVGNLLLQAHAAGAIDTLEDGRKAVAAALPARRFEPADVRAWRAAAARYHDLEAAAR